MNYLLRDIPAKLWSQVKRRAAKDGHSLKWVLLSLLGEYVKSGLRKPPTKDA